MKCFSRSLAIQTNAFARTKPNRSCSTCHEHVHRYSSHAPRQLPAVGSGLAGPRHRG